MPPARGVPPGSCRACGGRVAFSGGACRVSPGGCPSATCLPRTGEVGDSEVAAERRPRGVGGVVGAGRAPSDPLRRPQPSGAAEGQGRPGGAAGTPAAAPRPPASRRGGRCPPRPTSERPRASRRREAAPLRPRRVALLPGTRGDARDLQPDSSRSAPRLRHPARFPRTGGRGAAPGSDVTPRPRPRRLAREVLVPVSAVARTNLISSQGIEGFSQTL